MRISLRAAVFLLVAGSVLAQPSERNYAQSLVEKTLTAHPELTVLALHVKPPASQDNIIIASNIGRIGKKADTDDLSVLQSGKPRMEMTKAGDLSVELVMRDANGRPIGVIGSTFRFHPGTMSQWF
ncbi:hypothetical protein PPGU19_096800 (plasmid) [Paraburkholderia sp. PGU19]|uniref:hypothetical protein n=1 Tax=Paraburkholderia sp. PGU19 TaxID=2735434 RepID=UPI0015DB84BF|nr:hypothetical protein [Paraburkholderia sp. PGU19]BCG05112.1 hypothetical protein PPGU19_096800 [Paraburkholderia sp. PGU19]